MTDLEFIKAFAQISVDKTCKACGVDRSNMYTQRTKAEKVAMVREELTKQIKELLNKSEQGE